MKKRIFSMFLAAILAAALLAGCSDNKKKDRVETVTLKEKATDSVTPLVAGYDAFSSKFSPFFAETVSDMDAVEMTQAPLLTLDREGGVIYHAIEGETVPYNGTDYTYTGIADWDVSIDEETEDTTYTIRLRDNVTFSDGEPMTIDDVIFNMYVLCDTDYDGGLTLFSQPIKGIKEYRANFSLAGSITDEMIAAEIEQMPKGLEDQVRALIVDTLESEYAWVESEVLENPAVYGLEEGITAKQAFVKFYAIEDDYILAEQDLETMIAEIADMYGTDYKALASVYAGDESYFDKIVNEMGYHYAIVEMKAEGKGEEVPNIAGIQKIDDYTMQVVTDGYQATTIYQMGIMVAPLHYYGDKSLYDYDNNSFGFSRGDLSSIRDKTQQPIGAGPYVFEKYENKIIYFTANQNYYRGAPKIKNIQFKETAEADKVAGIVQGTIDLSSSSGSREKFQQICEINDTGELNGNNIMTCVMDHLGYGYLGCNADMVKVGQDASSESSKNLRKAFMTIFSVYRDVAVDSYYGDSAAVIDYPVSNTSWAAPRKSEPDYQTAYSLDVDGIPIYTNDMDAEEKYEAAAKASLGFFEAAGYTVADGKVTAPPKGAKMEYEVVIPAEGGNNHPALSILTDAAASLQQLGITLTIHNPSDSNIMFQLMDAGTQEFWVAAWQASVDPDMYQTYYSSNIAGRGGTNSNYYHIADARLDELIMEARQSNDKEFRRIEYKECLNIVLDWAVELPIYQRQNSVIYSPKRIASDTVTKDITPYYKWYYEIYNFEMN